MGIARGGGGTRTRVVRSSGTCSCAFVGSSAQQAAGLAPDDHHTSMAITKAPRDIRVVVPRHNSQTIGAKLDVEIRRQAKAKSIRVDVAQPVPELAQAIVSVQNLKRFDGSHIL